MTTAQHHKLSFKLNWRTLATFFGLLYYLPYYFKNMLTNDTAQLNSEFKSIVPAIKGYLISQAKPLYGINSFLYTTFSFELLTLLGVVIFVWITIKFVELVLTSLNSSLKLLVFLLLFVNPFIYVERDWAYQFFGQSLITVLYYFSFYAILKYKEKPLNLAKLFLAYLFPIGSLVIGLNYFMPSFFHFVALCMVIVLKRHVENPFKTIAETLGYAKNFLIIIILGSLIYVVEIIYLWHLLDYSLDHYHNRSVERNSGLNLKERLSNLPNRYKMLFNYIGLIFTAILLLSKRNLVNIFLFFMVGLVCSSSYFFYLALDMKSTTILQFSNYYLTFFIAGLLFVKYQVIFINSKLVLMMPSFDGMMLKSDFILQVKLRKILWITSILFLVYFYFSSYYFYYVKYQQNKRMENLAYSINSYVIKNYHTSETPKIILLSFYNMDKINKNLLSTKIGFFNVIYNYYAIGFKWVRLGLPNIESYSMYGSQDKTMSYIKDKQLRNTSLALVNAGKIFPHPQSVFLYQGVYYVVN